jgi:hypothetical protein
MTALITSMSAQRSSEMRAYAAERRRAEKARRGDPGRTAAQGVPAAPQLRCA